MSVDSTGSQQFMMKPQIKRMCTNKEGEYRSRQQQQATFNQQMMEDEGNNSTTETLPGGRGLAYSPNLSTVLTRNIAGQQQPSFSGQTQITLHSLH